MDNKGLFRIGHPEHFPIGKRPAKGSNPLHFMTTSCRPGDLAWPACVLSRNLLLCSRNRFLAVIWAEGNSLGADEFDVAYAKKTENSA